jgi:hypothetical protein
VFFAFSCGNSDAQSAIETAPSANLTAPVASLDPILQARGIVGMTGAANEDRTLWKEFQTDVVKLGVESEQMLHDLFTKNETEELDFLQRDKVRLVAPSGPTESQATVKVRRGQMRFLFFR